MNEPCPSSVHLSANEQALWLETRLNPGFPGHLLTLCFELEPEPAPSQLQAALQRLALRHPRLSMRVVESGHGPLFVSTDVPQFEPRRLDSLPTPAALAELALEPLDMEAGPLLRWRRIECASGEIRHLFTAHHLLGDQRSLSGLVAELQAELASDAAPVLPAIAPHFVADTQASASPPRIAADHWQDAQQRPALIVDRAQARAAGIGVSVSRMLDFDETAALRLRADAQGVSRFELLLAAYASALDELYGACPRLLWLPALSTGDASRYDVLSFPLLLAPGPDRAASLASQVRARGASAPPIAWDGQPRHAVLHSRAPRGFDPAYAALGAAIDGQRLGAPVHGAPVLRLHALPLQAAAFASCAQVLSLDGTLQLVVQVDRALFEADTAEVLLRTWVAHALAASVAGESEHRIHPIGAARIGAPLPSLAALLTDACQRHADAIALEDGHRQWTYAELLASAQSLPPAQGALRVEAAPGAVQALQVFAGLLRGVPLQLGEAAVEPGVDCAVQLATSGSTGAAARIEMSATALASYAVSMRDQLHLRPGDRLLRFASVHFDAALEELLVCWLSGATVVCVRDAGGETLEARHLPFGQFVECLRAQRITVLNVGTAWFQAAMREELTLPASVRQLVIGGEACDAAAWNACRARHPGLDLVNTYGLTEACISQTLFRGEVAPGLGSVPLGWPLAHAGIEMLSPGSLEPAPALGEGELCIAGPSLGHSSREGQFIERAGRRLLRSGDRVRRDARGCLHYLGRLDRIHKHRGRRLCLDTLEQQARAAQGDEASALLARHGFDAQLWIAHRSEPQPALRELALNCGARLHQSTTWPRLPSGKTDRGALAAALPVFPDSASSVGHSRRVEAALLETLIGTVWPPYARAHEVLDSLGWLRLRSRLESDYGVKLARADFELSRLEIEARIGELQTPVAASSLNADRPALLVGFLDQVQRQPQATALIAGSLRLDYASLHAQVVVLARRLEDAGVGCGDRVAFHATRAPFDVLAMLSITLAGAAFVPIDADIGTAESHARCRQAGARFGLLPERVIAIEHVAAPEPLPDLAYVLFTSGSSGAPKAVAMTHAAAANTVQAVVERIGLGPRDRLLALSPTRFDLSVFDVFGSLGAGARLVWPDETQRADPAAWPALLREHAISVWNSVPSSLDLLLALDADDTCLRSLRQVLLSGDFVGQRLRERAASQLPGAKVHILGGATEAGIWSCAIDASAYGEAYAPYGPALRGQRLWVDAEVGEVGEICIGGDSLALGYLEAGALLARFDPHYATGDLGRVRDDGCIEILGRDDPQAKWRGQRVSVAELEAQLLKGAGVRAACVLSIESSLHALIQLDEGADLDALREHFHSLPAGTPRPEHWHVLAALPLTGNGKLDRVRLRSGLLQSLETRLHAPGPVGRSNEAAVDRAWTLWQQLLPQSTSMHEADWHAQGGHSLLALRLVEAAQRQGATAANLAAFLARPTLGTLASWFDPTSVPALAAPGCRKFSPELLDTLCETREAVFITGATGMLGRALAKRLAGQRPLLLAVRAADEAAARQRLAEFGADHVLALPLSLEQPRLGLDEASYGALVHATGEVWHIAAEVNFLLPTGALESANVEATARVFDLAWRARAPMHFASTLGVFPYLLEVDVDEASQPDPHALRASGYAESKWRAEQRLRALSEQAGSEAPALHLYRLGLIAGPTLRDQDILGIGARALTATQSWPQLELTTDVLALDDAVSAMQMLSTQPPATWHLQNPRPARLLEAHAALRPQWPLQPLSEWLRQLDTAPKRSAHAALSLELLKLLIPALPADSGNGRIRADRSFEVLTAMGWQARASLEVLRGLIGD